MSVLLSELDGTYIISNGFPGGTYYLQTTAQGYVRQEYKSLVCNSFCPFEASTPITVTSNPKYYHRGLLS